MSHHIEYELDRQSMLLTVSGELRWLELEAELQQKGFTLGYIGSDEELTIADAFCGGYALEPYLKHGDSQSLLAAVKVAFDSGEIAETVLSPRSAAGPGLRYLLTGNKQWGGDIRRFTLRVQSLPEQGRVTTLAFRFVDDALACLRRQVQEKNRPQFVRLYDAESSQALFLEGEEQSDRCVLQIGYEGDPHVVDFCTTRFVQALKDLSVERLDDVFYDGPLSGLALFAPPKEEQQAEVQLHVSIRWARVSAMLRELTRRAAGIYPVQTSLTGCWHDAALYSMRLLSYEGERDRVLISKEVEDLLQLLNDVQAVVLELRPLSGKIDKHWERMFSDPLMERLFQTP